MTLGIAEILKKEGFITDYNYEKNLTGDKVNYYFKIWRS